MTKLEVTLAGIVAALLLFIGWSFWERHEGSVACEDKDKAAVASQEAHNAAIIQTDTQVINDEAKAHANALAAAPDPTPILECVRYYASPAMPKTPTAQPPSYAPATLPASPGPSFDPAPAVGRIGQEADAQIAELQNYIAKVCQ